MMLVVFIYVQKCWVHAPMWHAAYVSYICNVGAIFGSSADGSSGIKGSHFHIVLHIVLW